MAVSLSSLEFKPARLYTFALRGSHNAARVPLKQSRAITARALWQGQHLPPLYPQVGIIFNELLQLRLVIE